MRSVCPKTTIVFQRNSDNLNFQTSLLENDKKDDKDGSQDLATGWAMKMTGRKEFQEKKKSFVKRVRKKTGKGLE